MLIRTERWEGDVLDTRSSTSRRCFRCAEIDRWAMFWMPTEEIGHREIFKKLGRRNCTRFRISEEDIARGSVGIYYIDILLLSLFSLFPILSMIILYLSV